MSASNTTLAPARRTMNRWEALAILTVLAFLNYLDRNLIFPLSALIQRDLHLSATAFGALATGFYLVYGATAPVLGYVSDRVARKTVLLVSLVAWSVITALSGTATSFGMLLVMRAMTGLGEGGYFPTATSIIGDLFTTRERGRVIALHGVLTTIGGSVGYVVGGALGEHFGWRMPFFLAIVPGLALAAVVAWRFQEPPRGSEAPVESTPEHYRDATAGVELAPPRRSYGAIVLSPPVLLISLAACAATFTMNGLNTFLPLYLHTVRGVSIAQAGVLTGLLYGTTMLGQLSGGFASDRYADRFVGVRPLLVALPFVAVFPIAIAFTRTSALALALACYGFTQFARGFAEPNIYCTVIDGTQSRERGSAQGFMLAMNFVGGSISPLVTGFLIARFGHSTAIDVLGVMGGIAGILAFALFIVLRRRAQQFSAYTSRVP